MKLFLDARVEDYSPLVYEVSPVPLNFASSEMMSPWELNNNIVSSDNLFVLDESKLLPKHERI